MAKLRSVPLYPTGLVTNNPRSNLILNKTPEGQFQIASDGLSSKRAAECSSRAVQKRESLKCSIQATSKVLSNSPGPWLGEISQCKDYERGHGNIGVLLHAFQHHRLTGKLALLSDTSFRSRGELLSKLPFGIRESKAAKTSLLQCTRFMNCAC
jgi:hypothetical protein